MVPNKIKIHFLGTNGWYDTKTGNTICVLIESEHEYVILDAGNGLFKIDQYIKPGKPIYLFLSHFHFDHLTGLHIMAKFRFKQGFNICIPAGRRKEFNLLMNKPYTVAAKDLKMKTKIFEVSLADKRFPFLKRYLPLRHSDTSMGMRFGFGEKIITYIPDTGLCCNAYVLAEEADLLIAECAMKPGIGDKNWPHLNYKTAAQLAFKSKAKKMVLVHFDAEVYKTLEERKDAAKQARKIFANTLAAEDGMTIEI